MRSLALTSTSVGAGLVAHWAAGGSTPHPAALLVVLSLLTLPVARLSVREVSPGVAVAVLGAGQAAVHLTGMASHGAVSASSGAAHDHTVTVATSAAHAPGAAMLAGHLAVTLALALVWSRGERILFAVAARLRPPSLPRWVVPAPVALVPCTLAPLGATLARRPPGRGPPRPAR